MQNLNKAQIIPSRQYFNSDTIGNRTIDRSLAVFEDYRRAEINQSKITGKVKFNLGIAYFTALTIMLFILFA
jgi:hypothetical protein